MGDQERKGRAAGADQQTEPQEAGDDYDAGLLSQANVAKLRESADRGSGPAEEDVVAAVTGVNVAPDRGDGARIYITLEIGTKRGFVPSLVGQLRIVNGAFIPQGRFEIERVSPTQCVASIQIKDGTGAEILARFENGTLEAVIFGTARHAAPRPHAGGAAAHVKASP